ncbi:hypothetical protein BDV40DRAFT_275085 [Aspergillus tamarii]|uniref:Uncharacterized protein n=1 Tax=Aspergillus tamarii TaxID=41984 RepID=A0A5N6UJD4_ASPTM|nr:hypothetical protein BDV40DRAFT_275085 [Aspergillus tamarii]
MMLIVIIASRGNAVISGATKRAIEGNCGIPEEKSAPAANVLGLRKPKSLSASILPTVKTAALR